MARFRSFPDAVAYYEAEHGLTRKRAIERAMKRCPSLVKKMARDACAQLKSERQVAGQVERITAMLADMREEARRTQWDNALAMIEAEKARRVREGTM